jgi:PST family polysaccharide transporter
MSLAQRATRGAAWNVSAGIGLRVLGVFTTVLLTRFIAPTEYGEVAAAAAVTLVVVTFTGLGFARYLIARSATDAECSQAVSVQGALTGTALAAAVALGAPIGTWIGVPGLTLYLPGMAVAYFVKVLGGVPQALLARGLHFGTLASALAIAEIAFAGTALLLAPTTGAMAIVYGNLARSAVATAILFWRLPPAHRIRPAPVRRTDVRRMLAFGLPLSASNWLTLLATRWDGILVGRYLGAGVLGHYNLATNLAQVPAVELGSQLNDVLFPAMAQLHGSRRRAALPRTVGIMALLMMPLIFGIVCVAPLAVSVALDERWRDVGWMASLLAIGLVGLPLEWPVLAHLSVGGRSSVVLALGGFKAVSTLGLLIAVGWQRPAWACGAVVAGGLLNTVATVVSVRRDADVDQRAVLRALAGPLLAALTMTALVVGLRPLAPPSWPGWLWLLTSILAGVASYLLGTALFARATCADVLELARASLFRRRPGPARADGGGPQPAPSGQPG